MNRSACVPARSTASVRVSRTSARSTLYTVTDTDLRSAAVLSGSSAARIAAVLKSAMNTNDTTRCSQVMEASVGPASRGPPPG